ncbi:MAG: hypothetical protein RLZ14_647 [Actinomycetota bacterium]
MRPLSLTFQAFGSYPGLHTVDFEALGKRGLFLVTGPTGTGKTTVFDAMVFALYGGLPGGRSKDGEARSHHADPHTETFVELDFEVGGARYRVRRTPTQDRPKKRGGGFTSETGSATLVKLVGTTTEAVATSTKTANEACERLVGLDSGQFQRVVLLPQGKFTDFLLATNESRKELLSELFGGDLYDRATEWLKSEKKRLDALVRDSDVEVKHHRDNAISELQRALGLWQVLELADEPSDHDLVGALEALGLERELSQANVDAARERAEEAGARATAAEDEAKRFDQAQGHRRVLANCEGSRDVIEQSRTMVDASALARPVVEAQGKARDALAALAEAASALSGLESQIAESFGAMGRPVPAFDATSVSREVAELAGSIVDDDRLLKAVADQDKVAAAASATVTALVGKIEGADRDLAAARAAAEAVSAEVEGLRALAGTEAAAGAAFGAATTRLAQRTELDTARAELRVARATEATAKAAYEDTLAAFVATQAPRLAATLCEGDPCPVCGSAVHPAKAEFGAQRAVDHHEVDAARAEWSRHDNESSRLDEKANGLSAALGADAEGPIEPLQAAVDAARESVEQAGAAAARLRQVEADLVAANDRVDTADRAHRHLTESLAGAKATDESAAVEAARLRGHIAHLDLAELEVRRRQVAVLQGVADSLESAFLDHTGKRQSASDAQAALDAALSASGFGSVADAEVVLLPLARQNELAGQVQQWDESVRKATEALETLAAVGVPAERPDAEALREAAGRAAAESSDIAREHTTAANALRDASEQLQTSRDLAAGSSDLRAQRDNAERVFKTCNGEAGIKVKLESWVLAAELDRVTAAANLHLGHMSNGRYRLTRKGGKGGLDLQVFDAHTGRERATASLSGGEQFQASLSLALGLADVVSHGGTASGKQFEALFVDEGFGSLDPKALDDAIEALSLIQAGGRMVGAITHVEAMKERLHTGIEVKALPDGRGSTLSVNP